MSATNQRNSIILALFLFLATSSFAQEGSFPTPVRERIEWCDIWFTDAEKDELPRVLLIGDSIARGYFGGVEKALEGNTYLGRLTTSRSVCDPVFFHELDLVLGQYEFDVIHFNNGLHGWGYTEEQYKQGFDRFLDVLEEKAPEAKLICALSTPVLADGGMAEHAERVSQRNTIVTELCAEENVPVNDLHALMKADDAYFASDGVHFTPEAREVQAAQVAEQIAAALLSPDN
jgi:hypothetical protein